MQHLRRSLLGVAAGLFTVTVARAADMPVKANPVQYVKICSGYGDGFYYIPGTDTCIKMGGYLRIQGEYNAGAGGIAVGNGGTEAPQGRFARDVTNDFNYRLRTAIAWDVRQKTEYGVLRTYVRFGAENTTPAQTGAGTTFSPYWDRAFIQFAGFTLGKTLSFFDIFTYSGVYAYHDPKVTGDTTVSNGLPVWAYTAQFGNGVTGTLSLEDPAVGHGRAQVVDANVPGFFAVNGVVVGDTAFAQTTVGVTGMRMPDIVVNSRVDQAWGFAGVSAVLHDASGGYYGNPNNVNNGHPADKVGWAAAVGGKLNLPGGDSVGANFCYSEGAASYCSRQQNSQNYNASTSVGVGWISDGVFALGTEVELTRVWSAMVAYEHIWNPRWKTSWFGGYLNVNYNDRATDILNSALVAGSVCPRPFAGIVGNFSAIRADIGNSCNPDYSYYEIGTRTQFNPVPQLDIGFEVLYSHLNTAFKGAALYTVNAPRPAVTLIDDQNIWSAFMRWQRNFYP
jgi:hypothetical protein